VWKTLRERVFNVKECRNLFASKGSCREVTTVIQSIKHYATKTYGKWRYNSVHWVEEFFSLTPHSLYSWGKISHYRLSRRAGGLHISSGRSDARNLPCRGPKPCFTPSP